MHCNIIEEEVGKKRIDLLIKSLKKAKKVENNLKGLKIHFQVVADRLAIIFNAIGVELANKGKNLKALSVFKKAKKYNSTNKVFFENIKVVRANLRWKTLKLFIILSRILYIRTGFLGALIGALLSCVVLVLISWVGFGYADILLFGLFSGALLLTVTSLVSPLWFLGAIKTYTSTIETLWRRFRGRAVIASVLVLVFLPFASIIYLVMRMFGAYFDYPDIKNSYTKSILSLGVSNISLGWLQILYLWLILGSISCISFWARSTLHLSNFVANVLLCEVGMYIGLFLALILFPFEEHEESYGNRSLKFHKLYPEAHLIYILLGGLTGLSPWLWNMLSAWLSVNDFLRSSSGLINVPNLLVTGGVVGILYSIVCQFMTIRMCKN